MPALALAGRPFSIRENQPGVFWEWIPDMRSYHRLGSRGGRRVSLHAEPLEHRTLLSGASASQHVAIDVPNEYVSQQADQLTVTLVRSSPSGHSRSLPPLTIDFWAAEGSLTKGGKLTDTVVPTQFTPVNESIRFPAGVTTETVAVPINPGAPNPGTVPVRLGVSSTSGQARNSALTVYLANSLAAVPPSIVAVERVAGGIAITFSKPMDPARVQDIHNYAVRFTPSQQFNLVDLTGVGLIQQLTNGKQPITLRRATYDSATNTVLLVADEQLGPNGAYTISNAPSLRFPGNRPNKARALTDLEGNPLEEEDGGGGVFSINISKGHPYAVGAPALSDGS
jgi:hypothetical protein